jgi:hypothetical protein
MPSVVADRADAAHGEPMAAPFDALVTGDVVLLPVVGPIPVEQAFVRWPESRWDRRASRLATPTVAALPDGGSTVARVREP